MTDRGRLTAALDTAGLAIQTRSAVPVMSGVLITGHDNGDATLTGFDYQTAITVTLPEAAHTPGQLVVSHAELRGVLSATAKGTSKKRADAAPVTLAMDHGTPALTVDGYTIPVEEYPTDDYPVLPDAPAAVASVDRDRFVADLARTHVATVSPEWGLPVLETVRMEATGDRLSMVATDRYRIAWATLPALPDTPTIPGLVLVHGASLAKLVKRLSGDVVRVGMSGDGSLFSLTCGTVRVLMRGHDGRFPTFKPLMPTTTPVAITAGRTELLTATMRGRAILKAKKETAMPLAVTTTRDTVTIAPDLPGSTAAPQMPVKTHGIPVGGRLRFLFRAEFLEEALSSFTADTVTLHATAATKPVVFTDGDAPADSADFRHLLMPIRPPN
ncbi:DNA polymerase III subunit beta [Nocardiopsis sp. NRRL B-16309]|uniref:DNA polymerase III subunit beta n=1 Tax=Nocardiopsis sp. NRRL B-16309 TaxID=1519494 RepID=UPI0006AF0BC0|nr:DNA polymerase III subunit beta [Nocardiopsis sp. NRRL B-16309]KOX23830.1 hypothetical protein ADL05_01885 [Nocardiopsis sp. NRRL B-16309]